MAIFTFTSCVPAWSRSPLRGRDEVWSILEVQSYQSRVLLFPVQGPGHLLRALVARCQSWIPVPFTPVVRPGQSGCDQGPLLSLRTVGEDSLRYPSAAAPVMCPIAVYPESEVKMTRVQLTFTT